MRLRPAFCLLFAAFAASCSDRRAPSAAPLDVTPPVPSPTNRFAAERGRCEVERAKIAALPELPGAPGFEERRGELLGRAKGEAVVFLRAPQPAKSDAFRIAIHRDRLAKASPLVAVASVEGSLRHCPEDQRTIFLREGYVYAESPELATTLVDVLKLGHLFRESEIFLARGAEVLRLERDDKGGYRHAEGDFRGEEASLLFGDRVGARREDVESFLHRDLAKLVQQDAPDRVRITRLTESGALADLRWGDDWVPAALADDGRSFRVSCVALPEGREEAILAAREERLARARSIDRVRKAVREMVRERLRFDEPLEEVGQQDGSLRPLWRWSYEHGGTSYSFNEIGYPVFDASGRPSPPQVCVDFVLDAYERASGTWFRRQDEPRERTAGTIDFEGAGLENRRSAAEFATFASAHPEWFRVYTPPDEARVPFGRRTDFFQSLAANADLFHPGDIVVIHGMKSDGKVHYHSFLVDAIDPISGIPYRLAGNAGRPRLQTWEGVMRSAPQRSIRHVITPELAFLREKLPPESAAVASR